MKRIGIVVLTLFVGFSFSAIAKDWAKQEEQMASKAQKHLKPLKMGLKKTLQSSIKEKGLTGALSACKIEAPKIRKKLNKDQIQVGRTSHKVRNERNQPKDWMKPYLKQYKGTKKGGKPARQVVALKGGRTGYLEPIYVGAVCINCHGSNLDKGLSAELKKQYPNDLATGFQLGEFRGFFWAEL